MKRFSRTISLVALCCVGALLIPSMTGCRGSNRSSEDEIWICVYDGGYGTEWIETLGAEYTEKTGTEVVVVPDQTILDRLDDSIKQPDYDLYFSHDINWQAYAAEGYLEPLDDLYESEVEGTGKTFAERNLDMNLEYSRYTGDDGEEHYYKVCYTQGCGGLVYNVDMFEENGWEVPTTYEELSELCETIVAAQIPYGSNRGEYVVPFAWCYDRQYYWDYVVFEWWAQLAGLDKVNQVIQYMGPTGEYTDGYEMYNPDTYYKEFIEAYELWYDLIVPNNSYYATGAQGASLAQAQGLFANEGAAMIPYAQWAKYEISRVTDDRALPFNIAFMDTPTAPNAVETEPVNYLVGYGDSMIVSKAGLNPDGAKDFLRYMATYEACHTFVEKAQGAFLAFDYSDVDISDLTKNDTYTASVYNKLTQSNSFTLASTNEITIWTTNKVMPWIENTYYYANAVASPESNTPEIVGQTMYDTAKAGWSGWLRSAGIGR